MFGDQAIITEDYLYDHSVLDAAGVPQPTAWVAVSINDGASPTAIDTFVTNLRHEFPAANVETADQFRERMVGMIDQMLTMVNIMVALAVIIALIGIANTLALSVFGRTRELGPDAGGRYDPPSTAPPRCVSRRR